MSNHFTFQISDIFVIKHRGVVVTGRVVGGTIHSGDIGYIQYTNGRRVETKILAIEAFRKIKEVAIEGDNVGLLLNTQLRKDLDGAEYIVSSADPTKIQNTQTYYERAEDPYASQMSNRKTMIDGKAIEDAEEERPSTLFERLFKRNKTER